MKSQIFIQLHIAFFAQILHNLNLKQKISILFPEHLRGDQRAQQKVFTPSDWINLSNNLEKKQERGALKQVIWTLQAGSRSVRTCIAEPVRHQVSASNTYLDHDSSILS